MIEWFHCALGSQRCKECDYLEEEFHLYVKWQDQKREVYESKGYGHNSNSFLNHPHGSISQTEH